MAKGHLGKTERMKLRYGIGQRQAQPKLTDMRQALLKKGIKNTDVWISTFWTRRIPEKSSIIETLPRQKQIPVALMLEEIPPLKRERVAELLREGIIKPEHVNDVKRIVYRHPEIFEKAVDLIKKGLLDSSQIGVISNTVIYLREEPVEKALKLLEEGKITPEEGKAARFSLWDRPDAAVNAIGLAKEGVIKKEHIDDVARAIAQRPEETERTLALVKEGIIRPQDIIGVSFSLKKYPEQTEKAIELARQGAVKPEHIALTAEAIERRPRTFDKALELVRQGFMEPSRIQQLSFIVWENPKVIDKAAEMVKKGLIKKEHAVEFALVLEENPQVADKVKDLLERGVIRPGSALHVSSLIASYPEVFEKAMDAVKRGAMKPEHVVDALLAFEQKPEALAEWMPEQFRESLPVPVFGRDSKKLETATKALRSALKSMGEERVKTKAGYVTVPKSDTITKKEIINEAIKTKTYVKELEKILPEKATYAELNGILGDLRRQSELMREGVEFGAEIKKAPVFQKGGITIAAYPTEHEIKTVEAKTKTGSKPGVGGHVEGAIGYVRFHKMGDAIAIENMQSDIHEAHLPSALRKRYGTWADVLMSSVEKYAKEHGFKRIIMTTADDQMLGWTDLSPLTAHSLYSELPKKKGFALKEGQKSIGAFPMLFKWWEKKVQ
jgi:hypothetical protein